MLYVTGEALVALGELKVEAGGAESESVLLYLDEDGELGIGLAEIEETEQPTNQAGGVNVVVSDDLAAALEGMLLDVVVDEDGEAEFIIVDPRVDEIDLTEITGFEGSGST
jgi:hypothetical protein